MVPLKFAIPLLFIIPLVVWFSGIRKYDFMTARVIPASQLRPDFASPVEIQIAGIDAGQNPSAPEAEVPELPEIDPGDFQTAPGLDEYQDDAKLGGAAMLQLAQKLQNAGQVQRAVLAFERILDSTPPGGSANEEAEMALANLKTTLPLWNSDPEAAIPLEIHLDTAREAESLSGAIATLSELITVGSGNQCQPTFQIHLSEKPQQPLPSLPVAIWLTVPSEDPDKPSLAVVTLAPKSDEDLNSRLTHGLYRLLARRIVSVGQLNPLPPLLQGEDPENAVVNKVTRLAWKQILATPFQSLEAGPPSEDPSDESSPEASPSTEMPEGAEEEEIAQ